MSFNNLDETSPTTRQPRGLKIKLKPHQLTSIRAMNELENKGSIIINNPVGEDNLYDAVRNIIRDDEDYANSKFVIETNSAILADKVGSGKTYMTIGLILKKLIPNSHNRFIIGKDHFFGFFL